MWLKVYMKDTGEFSIIKVGDRIPKGSYVHLLSRYHKVLNYQMDNRVVSIGTAALAPGPYRIILDTECLDRIETFGLFEREIVINDEFCLAYSNEKMYQQPCKPAGTSGLESNQLTIKLLGSMLESERGNLLNMLKGDMIVESEFDQVLKNHFLQAFDALWKGDEHSFAQLIKGRGKGSTPSGDDFLMGYLIGMSWLIETYGADLRSRREDVYHTALGVNPLVNTFLDQAYQYQLDQNWALFLNCLAMNNERELWDEFTQIADMGNTSGEDMLSGFLISVIWNMQDMNWADMLEMNGIKKDI